MNTMQVEERTLFRKVDWNFALIILGLNIIGLINLFSATHSLTSADSGINRLFVAQIFWLVAGWIIFLLVTIVNYQIFIRLAYVVYGINLVLLVATTFVGKIALGAQRWLDFGIFSYQPSETMKVALVLVLARYLSQKVYPDGLGLKELVTPLFLILVPFLITAEQPDLGTGMMLFILGSSVLLFIKIRTPILVACAIVVAIALPIGYFYALKDYQRHRVETFINPSLDPRGKGYNSIQSRIAVGSGKFLGKGFQKGSQNQLEFLPERHTDFIFSVLSEEHGFVGSMTTVILFCLLFAVGIRIASQARDRAGAIMVIGVLATLFWHMFINIGMVIGLLPIVGVPLPLLSYGGSSMLTTMAALGLISSVSYRRYLF